MIHPVNAIRRRAAARHLDHIDAQIARWLLDDGCLYYAEDDKSRVLACARRAVARDLELAGGHDPHPSFTTPRSAAQNEAFARSLRRRADAWESQRRWTP